MKLGLALQGGGIRGVAHIGVLKALEENNIKIDVLGGTSSGSMATALFAMGFSPDEIFDLVNKYARTIVILNGNIIRKEIKNFVFYRKIYSKGINDGAFIKNIFNKVAKSKNIYKISDISMPIIIPAVDIVTRKKYIFTSKDVNKNEQIDNYINNIDIGRAVQASCSYPLLFSPMEYDNKLFLDGGILDNIPVKEVKKLGANKVIAIKFDSDRISSKSNAVDIIIKIADIMGEEVAKENLNEADLTIEIPTDRTGLIDINKTKYCFKSGYEMTMKNMDKIKKMLEEK